MSRDELLGELEYPDTDLSPEQAIRKSDARDLPVNDDAVDLIFTSPPYWQKRDYGHSDQIGQEETPKAYIQSLMEALDEWERVLRDTGTILLNIGDKFHNKSRMGLPWKFAEAARDKGWRIRSEIVWHKPNGMPTPSRNRFNTRHEYIFHLTPKGDYYFDKFGFEKAYDDAIDVWKVPHDRNDTHLAPYPEELVERGLVTACPPAVCEECGEPRERIVEKALTELNPDRPQAKRAMRKFRESDLEEKHIKAIRATGISDAGKGKEIQNAGGNSDETKQLAQEAKDVLGGYFREFTFPIKTTTGWTTCDCKHQRTVPGTVLDPFAGSGTTVEVAEAMGFSALGVDISPPEGLGRYAQATNIQ